MRQNLINEGSLLWCDFYHLTMSGGWFAAGKQNEHKTSEAFFRKMPKDCGYIVSAGLGEFLEWVENWQVTDKDIAYLAAQKNSNGEPLFSQDFLTALRSQKLQVDVKAVPEGELVFAGEPLYSISGPNWQVELVEAALLNILNSQNTVATKAARAVYAAQSDGIKRPVMEFGLRRAMEQGGLSPTRAAFVGGCVATSNVAAAQTYHIPPVGTMAHSWIMSFENEVDAFKTYLQTYPYDGILLPDTYETRQGILNAIKASKETKIPLKGIRLDSGDLAYWSKQARKLLDDAGMKQTKIITSNDLDEYIIEDLIKVQKAPIDSFALGTKLVRADDMPALGCVYKTKNYEGKDKIKVAGDKTTIPGKTNVIRLLQDGKYNGDVVVSQDEDYLQNGVLVKPLVSYHLQDKTQAPRRFAAGTSAQFLLQDVVQKGQVDEKHKNRPLTEIQQVTMRNLQALPEEYKRLRNPHRYGVGMNAPLYQKQQALIQHYQNQFGR